MHSSIHLLGRALASLPPTRSRRLPKRRADLCQRSSACNLIRVITSGRSREFLVSGSRSSVILLPDASTYLKMPCKLPSHSILHRFSTSSVVSSSDRLASQEF
ncbi:hypothetical protein BU23DRAFT_155028 [Bimuria novae-zelandiae CBS 107.79]|uniref:Uncharacterized protein n=1 Tax=Bimuria novae-zelandiae CBS 107.79 TaxID=1447943 RepID=A0A6A5V6B0_9PLEO|nr:hypothetical protein BU23DRAFT_155028 [Bimuria novae-zelandiae CBS 107.79]